MLSYDQIWQEIYDLLKQSHPDKHHTILEAMTHRKVIDWCGGDNLLKSYRASIAHIKLETTKDPSHRFYTAIFMDKPWCKRIVNNYSK